MPSAEDAGRITRLAPPSLDLTSLQRWIVDQGLRGVSLEELVHGFCQRVVEVGFPARRFSMIIGTLHPRHGARSYTWRPTGLETRPPPGSQVANKGGLS